MKSVLNSLTWFFQEPHCFDFLLALDSYIVIGTCNNEATSALQILK